MNREEKNKIIEGKIIEIFTRIHDIYESHNGGIINLSEIDEEHIKALLEILVIRGRILQLEQNELTED